MTWPIWGLCATMIACEVSAVFRYRALRKQMRESDAGWQNIERKLNEAKARQPPPLPKVRDNAVN